MNTLFFRDAKWMQRPVSDNMRVLDVGAGGMRRAPHVTTMDVRSMENTDVVHDADVFPWPFEDDSFDYIILSNVLEHVENIGEVLDEIQRIGRDGAMVRCICPHFSNPCTYVDVTHRHALSVLSLNVFCLPVAKRSLAAATLLKKVAGCDMAVADKFRENKFILNRRSLYFREALWFTLIPIWGNLLQEFFEVYISRFIPAWAIYWELIIFKSRSKE